MDTIYDSPDYHQDCLRRPTGGVPPRPPPSTACTGINAYNYYPAHFPEFTWWQEEEKRKPTTIVVKNEFPIPTLYNPYNYRYTSAQPCSVGRTKKEWDMYKRQRQQNPIITVSDKLNPRSIRQIKGYETVSMTASLEPFLASLANKEAKEPGFVPRGLNEPSVIPFHGITAFDKYVIDYLYPNWKSNPLYRKRIQFAMKPGDPNKLIG